MPAEEGVGADQSLVTSTSTGSGEGSSRGHETQTCWPKKGFRLDQTLVTSSSTGSGEVAVEVTRLKHAGRRRGWSRSESRYLDFYGVGGGSSRGDETQTCWPKKRFERIRVSLPRLLRGRRR